MNIRRIQFRFGNAVYRKAGFRPVIYNGLNHIGDLIQYMLLGPEDSLVYSVGRIAERQPLYQQTFSLRDSNAILCKEQQAPFCRNHDSSLRFFERLCDGRGGADLKGDLREIVSLIYKRVGWELDPPEEFADNFVDDPRGFAIIEISVSTDTQWEEPLFG